jgi:hypothetical protein
MPELDDTRPFPIQGSYPQKRSTVPWWLAEIAYEGYARAFPSSAREQSLERLAARGGFGRQEFVALIKGTLERKR